MESNVLLNRLRIFDDIYYIGGFHPPITFLSQQHRALNLVWALAEQHFDFTNKSIAVVGAGLSGLTAAAALRVRGSTVVVYEQTSNPLPMQQGNSTRFVLPHVYEWPTPGSAYPRTHLPFLNWEADSAGNIAEDVIKQWKRVSLDVKTNTLIRCVRPTETKPVIEFQDRTTREFDVIIVASGFGIENSRLAAHTPVYWRNDDFDQVVMQNGTFGCFISGIGDGGLLDALRIRLSNFRHGEFLVWLLRHPWFIARANEIRNELHSGRVESEIWQAFQNIELPVDIQTEFTNKARPNMILTLTSRHSIPMLGEALLSNKLAISVLWRLGLIEYKQRALVGVRRLGLNRYRVALEDNLGRREFLNVNKVITRHGPVGTLQSLIDPQRFTDMKTDWPRESPDDTAIPQFRIGFLSNEFMPHNFESQFEVIFALGTAFDSDRLDDISDADFATTLASLNLLGEQLNQVGFGTSFIAGSDQFAVDTRTIEWEGMACSFRLVGERIGTWRGLCGGPLIVVTTNYRRVLDTLLRDDPLRYHAFSYIVTADGLDSPQNLPQRDLETNAILFDERNPGRRLTLRRHYGMFQAHRLFSVQSLLDILHNRWTVSRIHKLGWLIGSPKEHLSKHWTIE
jgi:hypothetical protein